MYCLQARPCIFQPGSFTGWSSEGVKTLLPLHNLKQNEAEPGRSCRINTQGSPLALKKEKEKKGEDVLLVEFTYLLFIYSHAR